MVIKMYKQWIFIIIWNVFVFLIYGIDKKKAKKQKWRIPEKTLLMLAFLFGAPGASLGMRFFHHKTKKMKFKILIPLFFIFQTIIILYIYNLFPTISK